MKKLHILLAMLIAITVVSCREEADSVDNPTNMLVNTYNASYTTQFKSFWNVMNTGYNFWDVTDIDWDARYNEYEPKFEALDKNYQALTKSINQKATSATVKALTDSLNKHYRDTLAKYYYELTQGFTDHHMVSYFRNPYVKPDSSSESINNMGKRYILYGAAPSADEIKSRDYCHVDSTGAKMTVGNANVTFKNFLKVMEQYENGSEIKIADIDYAFYSGAASIMHLDSYYIYALFQLSDGKYVPYFWLSGFADVQTALKYLLTASKGDPDIDNIKHFKDVYFGKYMKAVTTLPKEKIAGAIFDVRENGGGAVADVPLHIGQFLGKSDAFWEGRHKEGMGRYDMSAYVDDSLRIWDDAKIEDLSNDKDMANIIKNLRETYGLTTFHRDFAADNIPVVCLADLYSISCSEIVAGSIKSMPTGYLVGERTNGSHGELNSNSGAYNLTYSGVAGDNTFQDYNYYIYTSNIERKMKGQPCLEGIGVSPDKEVLYNDKGYKAQLDAALEYINNYK